MKTLYNWEDLKQFGIRPLTGEACVHGMRLLCDLSTRGADTIRAFFGLPGSARLAENWNQGPEDDRSIGSVMLPRGIFQELAAFCLLQDGALAVAVGDEVSGVYPSDPSGTWEEVLEFARCRRGFDRTYSTLNVPREGSRAIHQFSGRTL